MSSTSAKDKLKSNVFIITSRQDVTSNSIDVKHLHSSQEEAGPQIILHSLYAGTTLSAFVCQLYEPGTNLVDVGELRWRLFTQKNS